MTDRQSSGPEVLARDILHGLADGRFVPGQRLAEPDLMARYGVGRSTVREALGRLASDGLVEIVPHRGAAIRRLTRREAADVLRVAAALLALAARQAAEAVLAGSSPAALKEAAAEYSAAGTEGRQKARARYYRALAALAGNKEVMRLLPSIQVPLVRAQMRDHVGASAASHAALVDAVSEGDPEAAEAAARLHLDYLLTVLPGLSDTLFTRDWGV